MTQTNRRITLAKRPVGEVTPDCFDHDEVEIPTPGPGAQGGTGPARRL